MSDEEQKKPRKKTINLGALSAMVTEYEAGVTAVAGAANVAPGEVKLEGIDPIARAAAADAAKYLGVPASKVTVAIYLEK